MGFINKTEFVMYGYGEDANTLVIMTKYLQCFLAKLEDKTPIEEVIVFFRPSFGRSSRTKKSAFGEFDSIVVTCDAIYLVEAKLYPAEKARVRLPDCQVLRHKIFNWYYENWKKEKPSSWEDFVNKTQTTFERSFPSISLPRSGTKLANNLESILSILAKKNVKIRNILLLPTNSAEIVSSPEVTPAKSMLVFEPVVIYVPTAGNNFVELHGETNLILTSRCG